MTLRTRHIFDPDADGDCRRCEFPKDELEVHELVIVEGEEVIGFITPFTSFSDDPL